ncbi:MAG TPA: hypothetical protein VNO22_07225, partial [Planctomycetota bacterium]|nr:hypothetical protein [Planctomycetota bacterium]
MSSILALAALLGAVQEDTAAQQEIQRRVRAETDVTARRVETMVRALLFHRLDQVQERRVLEEVAGTLSTLSREEMARVLERLRAAAAAPDADKARAEIDAAYVHHRRILEALERLLSRYDAVRDLEQAAERLERAAAEELELSLRTAEHARESARMAAREKAEEEARRRSAEAVQDFERQGRELQEQKKKLDEELARARKRVQDLQAEAARLSKEKPQDPQERERRAKDLRERTQAAERERAALEKRARETQEELARVERERARAQEAEKRERARQEDRRRIERAIQASVERVADDQGDLERRVRETFAQLAALKAGLPAEHQERLRAAEERAAERGLPKVLEEAARKLRASGDWERRQAQWRAAREQQAKAAADLRDLARALRAPLGELDALREARARIERALEEQKALAAEAARPPESREAEEALRDQEPAARPQQEAAARLEEALRDVDRRIAEAEKARENPLAALQRTAEALDRLIEDQKEARQATQEAPSKDLPNLAPRQQELAARAEELRRDAAAAAPKGASPLEEAARAMEKAGEALQARNASQAAARQDQALQALQEARAALAEAGQA